MIDSESPGAGEPFPGPEQARPAVSGTATVPPPVASGPRRSESMELTVRLDLTLETRSPSAFPPEVRTHLDRCVGEALQCAAGAGWLAAEPTDSRSLLSRGRVKWTWHRAGRFPRARFRFAYESVTIRLERAVPSPLPPPEALGDATRGAVVSDPGTVTRRAPE
jgi:hypothetical protein